MNLPLNLGLPQTQTQWSAILNPVINCPLVSGRSVTANLITGNTVINHGLSRNMQGWIIIDQTACAAIYRSQPFNDQTLTLTSSAAVTVTIWMF